MPQPDNASANQRTGVFMAFTGGMLLSIDVPILRMASTDAWTMIMVRGGLSFIALLFFWMLFRRGRSDASPFVNGYTSVFLSCITAISSILFLNAIQLTTVANVVFILAFNPMFCSAPVMAGARRTHAARHASRHSGVVRRRRGDCLGQCNLGASSG